MSILTRLCGWSDQFLATLWQPLMAQHCVRRAQLSPNALLLLAGLSRVPEILGSHKVLQLLYVMCGWVRSGVLRIRGVFI